jgi:hypothetical protein
MKKVNWVPMIAAFMSLSFPAFAAQIGRGPCRQDAEKLCSGLTWGKGLGKCLKEHKTELSDKCQAKIEGKRKEGVEFRQACGKDLKEFCANVKPGKGRIKECLKENAPKLSSACQKELNPHS